jgi:hypothetical protein
MSVKKVLVAIFKHAECSKIIFIERPVDHLKRRGALKTDSFLPSSREIEKV